MKLNLQAAVLSVALSLGLAGCSMLQKPTKASTLPPVPVPAPAPVVQTASNDGPLSVPQTDVYLPQPQPIDPAAVSAPPPKQPAEEPAVASRQPATNTPPPAKPEPAPVQTTPTPPVRGTIRVAETAEERRRIQGEVESRRRETESLINRAKRRRLSPEQQSTVQRIQAFLDQATSALLQGDTQTADTLSTRALLLGRDLTRE